MKSFFTFLAGLCMCFVKTDAQQISWTGKTNVFIGDSNTEGKHDGSVDLDNRFSAVLSSLKGSLEDNRGVSSMTVQNAPTAPNCETPDVDEGSIPLKTSNHLFLYIMLGSNDIAHNNGSFTPSGFQTRLDQIILNALAKGWPPTNIVLISPPWALRGHSLEPAWGPVTGAYDNFYDYCNPQVTGYQLSRVDEVRQQAYADAVQAVALLRNTVFIDLYALLRDHPNRLEFISDEYDDGRDRIHFNVTGHQFIANTLANFAYPTALPLHLVDFSAHKQNAAINLRWVSENEVNTKEFIVERADNRMQFQPIGKVQASKNSISQKEYALTDHQPLPGNNLYRLKMIDLDDKSEYSKTVMVNRNTSLYYSISPNPAKGNISVLVNNKNPIHLQIVDMSGRIVQQENLSGNGNLNNVNISLLTKGLYLVRLVDANETHLEKLIVH